MQGRRFHNTQPGAKANAAFMLVIFVSAGRVQ
jgi:hypothetical protein